jgi:hypothetical protein
MEDKMGYTHYLYRPKEIQPEVFKQIVADLKAIIEKAGVPLAGWNGKGTPELTDEVIAFNGVADCGHKKTESIAIAWPAKNANGINQTNNGEDVLNGTWFAGGLLGSRACGGDCSHETFRFERAYQPQEWQKPDKNGFWFCFCKTAYKPYDLIVQAAMIIIKHYLKDQVVVHSDGDVQHWDDARNLTTIVVRYGFDFKLDEGKNET